MELTIVYRKSRALSSGLHDKSECFMHKPEVALSSIDRNASVLRHGRLAAIANRFAYPIELKLRLPFSFHADLTPFELIFIANFVSVSDFSERRTHLVAIRALSLFFKSSAER